MQIKNNPWLLRLAGFALFLIIGGTIGLPSQETLPPSIRALFPANVINVSGHYVSNAARGTNLSGGDMNGDVPNTRSCSRSNPGTGGMSIKLQVWSGEYAKFMMDNLRKGIPQSISRDRKERQSDIDFWVANKRNPFVDTFGSIHEDAVPGGMTIWSESEGPCVEDENPRHHGVWLKAYSVQGSVYSEMKIGFEGEIGAAKAMLMETLDKIARTDFTKIANR